MKKNMFKFMRNLFGLLAIVTIFATSCKEPENEDPVTPTVEDGYYVLGTSIAVNEAKLSGTLDKGLIEGEGFAAVEREGMYEKWMFITASGDGFVIFQQAGATATTWGIDGAFADDQETPFTKFATLKDGGDRMTVSEDGFYHLIVDFTNNKAFLQKIDSWGVIGDATPGGWSNDTNMTAGTIDVNSATWTITDLPLYEGGYKFRYNDTWTYEFNEGEKAFTNLGGTEEELTPGGANLSVTAETQGIYTLTLKYTFGSGFSLTAEKTGDVTPVGYPDSLFLVGNFNNWEIDNVLHTANRGNGVYEGYLNLTADNEIKAVSVRGSWDENWGQGADNGTLSKGGANIVAGDQPGWNGDGFYQLKFNLADMSFVLTPITTVSVIGEAVGGWETDAPLVYNADDKAWEGTVTFSDGEYKFRANNDWTINWGGDLNDLVPDGGNLSGQSGELSVKLYLSDLYTFHATIE